MEEAKAGLFYQDQVAEAQVGDLQPEFASTCSKSEWDDQQHSFGQRQQLTGKFRRWPESVQDSQNESFLGH